KAGHDGVHMLATDEPPAAAGSHPQTGDARRPRESRSERHGLLTCEAGWAWTRCAAAVRAGGARASGDPRVLHPDGRDGLPAADRVPGHQGLRGILPRSPVAFSGGAVRQLLDRARRHQGDNRATAHFDVRVVLQHRYSLALVGLALACWAGNEAIVPKTRRRRLYSKLLALAR